MVHSVSVVIPALNAEEYIGRALECALGQVGVFPEVIVVDDGSSDQTLAIVEQLSDRVRILKCDRGGPAKARNLGARVATGEWLGFLDADDEWMPEKLDRQLALTNEQVDLVYTDRYNIGSANHVSELQSAGQSLFEGQIFDELLQNNFITLSSVLIRKSRFLDMGGFDESPEMLGVEDWDLWLRYALDGGEIALCREPLTSYRWHGGQISKNHRERALGRAAVVQKALSGARRLGRPTSTGTAFRAMASAWETSGWFAAPTDPWHAFGWFARSACYWPFRIRIYKAMIKCCIGKT